MNIRRTFVRRLGVVMVPALLAFFALPGAAFAQSGGVISDSTAMPYLFAAFAVVWVFMFGYLFFMVRRQHDLERVAQEIKEKLGGRQ